MSGHVTAMNKNTGKLQTVPAAWVDNPNRFGGVFVTPPAAGEVAEAGVAKPAKGDKGPNPEDPALEGTELEA